MSLSTDETRALVDVAGRLRTRFPQTRPEQVEYLVDKVRRQYDGRPIRDFVPVLVEREVADALSGQPYRSQPPVS